MVRQFSILLLLGVSAFGQAFTHEDLSWQGAAIPVASSLSGYPVDLLMQFEQGSEHDLVTTNYLNDGTVSAQAGNWIISRTNVYQPALYTRVSGQNLTNLFPVICNGTSYDTTGTRGIYFVLPSTGNPWEKLTWLPSGDFPQTNLVVSMAVRHNASNNCAIDLVLVNFDTAGWATIQAVKNGTSRYFQPHGKDGAGNSTVGPAVNVASNSLYFVTLKANKDLGDSELVVQDSTGSLVGASRCSNNISRTYNIGIGSYLSFSGGTNFVDNFMASWSSPQIPISPMTVPAVTNQVGYQLYTNTAIVSWSSGMALRYNFERWTSGSNAWHTINTNFTDSFYTDTNCIDGETNSYRITAIVGTNISLVSTTAPAIINNATTDAPFPESYYLLETAEGSGFSYGAWSKSGDAGYVVDPDYQTNKISGNDSVYIYRLSFGVTSCYRNITLSDEIWARFRFKFFTLRENVRFFSITDASTAALLNLRVTGGKLRLTSSATGTDSTESLAANTHYWVWVHYKKGTGTNAIAEAWFSESNTKPDNSSGFYSYITNATRTTQARTIYLEQSGSSVSGDSRGIYDNLVVSTNSF